MSRLFGGVIFKALLVFFEDFLEIATFCVTASSSGGSPAII